MASLDVLDYQVGLDNALAKPGPDGQPLLPAPLRKSAVREARRVIDAMAFRFAVMDERPLPEDLDYLRALEAVRAPEQAAQVLARRRPVYAAARRRRLGTTYTVLGVIVLLVGVLGFFATSEESVPLTSVEQVGTSATPGGTLSVNRTFEVTEDLNRLHLDGTVFVRRGSEGLIEVRLLDPAGDTAYYKAVSMYESPYYLRANVLDPAPGNYTLLVDFLSVDGSVTMTVDGVRPTR